MMKKMAILALIFLLIIVSIVNTVSFRESSKYKIEHKEQHLGLNSEEENLWNTTVQPYLRKDLETEQSPYNAGHFLMVPLHYAYQSSNKELMDDFRRHFNHFVMRKHKGIGKDNINLEDNRLATLHYYYLISRYIVLEGNKKTNKENVNYLANYLLKEIERIWLDMPAWQWSRENFQGGMRQRILWKLENKELEYNYYRAIIDEELFTFAIAADLNTYFSNEQPVLNDILKISYWVFQEESYFDKDGRWLFQPGVWSDHPDYLYAGYNDKEKINGVKSIRNIASDSSHFHRFPLWITSLNDTFPKGSKQKKLFSKIRKGLEKQFFDRVLISPSSDEPYYRLKNFMDGSNGVYRWNYDSIPNDGFGPYELSGTFTLGWWTFLDSKRIKHVYVDLARQFPLSEEAVDLYTGPSTSKDDESFDEVFNTYNSGEREMLAILASKIR